MHAIRARTTIQTSILCDAVATTTKWPRFIHLDGFYITTEENWKWKQRCGMRNSNNSMAPFSWTINRNFRFYFSPLRWNVIHLRQTRLCIIFVIGLDWFNFGSKLWAFRLFSLSVCFFLSFVSRTWKPLKRMKMDWEWKAGSGRVTLTNTERSFNTYMGWFSLSHI